MVQVQISHAYTFLAPWPKSTKSQKPKKKNIQLTTKNNNFILLLSLYFHQ